MPRRLPEVLLSAKQSRLRKQISRTKQLAFATNEFLDNFGKPAVPVAHASAFVLSNAVKNQSGRLKQEALIAAPIARRSRFAVRKKVGVRRRGIVLQTVAGVKKAKKKIIFVRRSSPKA